MVNKKQSNTNAICKVSLRGAQRRSNPTKNEIAAPFGLAMTVTIFISFVLVGVALLVDREVHAEREMNSGSNFCKNVPFRDNLPSQ